MPAVYYGEKPGKAIYGQTPERSTIWEVPDECMLNNEPIFGRLKKMFPAPN